jgi:bacterioferritin
MSTNNTKSATKTQPFLTDVTELRRRAQEHLEKGAVTGDYKGDVKQAVELLNGALATEIVCVLRYTMHWVTANGIASDAVKEEFKEHADEEREHMEWIADRIDQLGGTPDFDPKGLASRSASEFGKSELNLVEMIKENLIAERIAIEHYRELVEYFGANDSTSRRLMEKILAKEEEHATDMHDLLVAHEGRPSLKK